MSHTGEAIASNFFIHMSAHKASCEEKGQEKLFTKALIFKDLRKCKQQDHYLTN